MEGLSPINWVLPRKNMLETLVKKMLNGLLLINKQENGQGITQGSKAL